LTDFHTQTAQQHAQNFITKTISDSEYEQETMPIMMEAKWGDRVPLITPIGRVRDTWRRVLRRFQENV